MYLTSFELLLDSNLDCFIFSGSSLYFPMAPKKAPRDKAKKGASSSSSQPLKRKRKIKMMSSERRSTLMLRRKKIDLLTKGSFVELDFCSCLVLYALRTMHCFMFKGGTLYYD